MGSARTLITGIAALLILLVSIVTLTGRGDTPTTDPFGSPSPSPPPVAAGSPSPTTAPVSPALPTPDTGAQQETAAPAQTTPAPTMAVTTPAPTAAPTPATASTPGPIAAGPIDDDRGTTPVTGGGSSAGLLWLAGAVLLRRLIRR